MPGKGNSMGNKGGGHQGGLDQGPQGAGHGRSESSPGHMKREAGEQSARDFAPGHSGTEDRNTGRDTMSPEAAPDEMGKD